MKQLPRRQRLVGFVATIALVFAALVVVGRLVEPEITGSLSFWLSVSALVVALSTFAVLATPKGERWQQW